MISKFIDFIIPKKAPIQDCKEVGFDNLTEKRFSSFTELHSMAKFVIRFHECSYKTRFKVFLKKDEYSIWDWFIEDCGNGFNQFDFRCFKTNLTSLNIGKSHHQEIISRELKDLKLFLIFDSNK